MKKLLAALLTLVLTLGVFAACGNLTNVKDVALKYLDESDAGTADKDFNRNKFYQNDLKATGADPSAIYITEGAEKGYFYVYVTSDELAGSGYLAWRSKNLTDWECVGVAFLPDRDSWALTQYWAPEVIYDEEEGLYLMYYSAADKLTRVRSIGLAVSASPAGPFVQHTGVGMTIDKPFLDFTKMPDDHPLKEKDANGKALPMDVIDVSPFKDPATGDKYLYFVHNFGDDGTGKNVNCNNYSQSTVYVIKMTDWYTADYSSVQELLVPNFATLDGVEDKLGMNEGDVNEAPFMDYLDGKYYLAYSVHGYAEKLYSVRTAVSDSPMGPFTKLSAAQGGYLLSAESTWDHVSGTGHCSFVKAGGEMFIVYHEHAEREFGGPGTRFIAFDRVLYVDNGEGLKVPYVNGPSYSLQPLPAVYSGYRNVAPDATVTATNMAEGSNVKYLNDGLTVYHDYFPAVKEFEANSGDTVITLTFSDYVETSAIMIYNSRDFSKAFGKVDKIELDFESRQDGATYKGTAYTSLMKFDWDKYSTSMLTMRPGGAYVADYAPLFVKRVRITINSKTPIAISDIVILGK